MARQVVAFDIGTSQVKLAWVVGGKLKKAIAAELPDNMVSGGEIVSMDAMADFIRQTAKETGIPRADAAVVLPERLVYTRSVSLPLMTDAQLQYNLPFEFKDYLTQEKGQYYFDYSVQGVTPADGESSGELQLFACATLKSTIEAYRAMFRRAGFKLAVAMPEECAYAALVTDYLARTRSGQEDYCLVDIGYTGMRLQILRDGNIMTRRAVELGLFDLVRTIADQRGVDEHIAHAHMLSDYNDVLSDESSLEIYNRMAVEIMKAVNFYHYNNRGTTLQRIYLCGGGAAGPALREAISRTLDFEVLPAGKLLPAGVEGDMQWLCAKAIGCGLQKQEGRA